MDLAIHECCISCVYTLLTSATCIDFVDIHVHVHISLHLVFHCSYIYIYYFTIFPLYSYATCPRLCPSTRS
ncbi:hypothetical protein BDN72DRAFT_489942 [Pluteus cervinus]|uniref:Uncharacterized protein n=1 Tax=Pluteus cervinus TaxID=181527 RepID=A0ACD3A546_9AGAR|nr:hypothetical protein BDN72DRAFT_489942 [Pluteus cervinus]